MEGGFRKESGTVTVHSTEGTTVQVQRTVIRNVTHNLAQVPKLYLSNDSIKVLYLFLFLHCKIYVIKVACGQHPIYINPNFFRDGYLNHKLSLDKIQVF